MTFRFDIVEILIDSETQETMFCVVLGIFSLTVLQHDGHYKCRHKKKVTSLADVFIVGAQLERLTVSREGPSNYNLLPYPVYKYRIRRVSREPFIDAFSVENIQRPACAFEFYRGHGGATVNTALMAEYLPVRYCLFDYPFCDRSLWNSSVDSPDRPYATASARIRNQSEQEAVSFMLYHDEQLKTFSRIQREADGIVDIVADVEGEEVLESSDDDEEN